MSAEPTGKRYDSSEKCYGDQARLDIWESEQRQYFAEKGITDFEFTRETGVAEVRYSYFSKWECAQCQSPWMGDWCVKCGGKTRQHVPDFAS